MIIRSPRFKNSVSLLPGILMLCSLGRGDVKRVVELSFLTPVMIEVDDDPNL